MSESDDENRRGEGKSRPLFDPAHERAIERKRARERKTGKGAAGSGATRSNRDRTTGSTNAGTDATDRGNPNRRSGFASASDVTGRGVGFTLVTAALCALGYYGVLGLQDVGVQAFETIVPAPFYALTFAVLFVFSLVPRAHQGLWALGWSLLIAVFFGVLLALATEGGFYLSSQPEVITTGYSGLIVLALALVLSSVAYWGVLSAAKTA